MFHTIFAWITGLAILGLIIGLIIQHVLIPKKKNP